MCPRNVSLSDSHRNLCFRLTYRNPCLRLTAMTKQIESGTEDLKRDVIYEAEKEKLKSELMLMKKIEEIKGLETMCEKYQEEIKRVIHFSQN